MTTTTTTTTTNNNNLIDLSHTIEDGLITYKGLPAPLICDFLSREASKEHYAEGTSFHIGKIEMVANTGTYLDAPFHRFENGKDISELELNSIAGLDGIKVTVGTNNNNNNSRIIIDVQCFDGLKGIDLKGKAILIETGWCQYWNTDQYFEGHPYVTKEAANFLKDNDVALVGIDSLNIDNIDTGERPVHTTLLGANILIVEHLCNLHHLPQQQQSFEFFAVPVKVKGMGTFPVRAFAKLR